MDLVVTEMVHVRVDVNMPVRDAVLLRNGLLGGDVDKGYDLWLVGYLVLDVAFELGSGFGEEDERPICVAQESVE
jgi:hypothetical protein